MRILAIDPGPQQSAFVLLGPDFTVCGSGIIPNRSMLREIAVGVGVNADACVIELVGHYGTGQPAGKDIFHTCIWFGQFQRAWERHSEWEGAITNPAVWLLRKTVASHLCNSARANDSQVRQALLDRFPQTGKDGKGNPSPVGTQKNPGPLYRIKKDLWSALALAVTYADQNVRAGQ